MPFEDFRLDRIRGADQIGGGRPAGGKLFPQRGKIIGLEQEFPQQPDIVDPAGHDPRIGERPAVEFQEQTVLIHPRGQIKTARPVEQRRGIGTVRGMEHGQHERVEQFFEIGQPVIIAAEQHRAVRRIAAPDRQRGTAAAVEHFLQVAGHPVQINHFRRIDDPELFERKTGGLGDAEIKIVEAFEPGDAAFAQLADFAESGRILFRKTQYADQFVAHQSAVLTAHLEPGAAQFRHGNAAAVKFPAVFKITVMPDRRYHSISFSRKVAQRPFFSSDETTPCGFPRFFDCKNPEYGVY